jgi:DNA-binding response OmpR family regulator
MRILFVGVARSWAGWIWNALQEGGHSVKQVDGVDLGKLHAERQAFDAAIFVLDEGEGDLLMVPAIARLSSVIRVTPLAVLLAQSNIQKCAAMLRAGADVCLSGPGSSMALCTWLDRVDLMHRTARQKGDSTAVGLELDRTSRALVSGRKRALLTRRELLIVECLLRTPGTFVPTHRLIDYAWPDERDVDATALYSAVFRLRGKIARDLPLVRLSSSRDFGYRILPAGSAE